MSQIITATEAQALPGRVSLGLDAGESVVVALTDEDPTPSDNLRQTLLRPEAALLPAGCSPLFTAELVESGRYPVLRVRRVGRHPVDLLRPEGRLRLTQNTELRSGARLEVMAAGRRPVSLGLLFAAQGSAGARSAAGGGGSRASAAMAAQTTLLWLVPNIAALIRDPLDDLIDGAMEWVAKSRPRLTGRRPGAITSRRAPERSSVFWVRRRRPSGRSRSTGWRPTRRTRNTG